MSERSSKPARVVPASSLASLGLLLISLLIPTLALAGIGEAETSVAVDAAALGGTHGISSRSLCRVHEIKTTAQTIREYATLDGKVFAVTWRGLGEPDLSRLFGSYYRGYRAADAATPAPAGRLPRKIQSSGLVVLKFGHMRDVMGKAYAPSLVPSSFDLKDLR